jgi:gluconokinase
MAGAKYLVVMGVSGSGKSTIAAMLALRLGATFVDGDDLHPAANIAKMRAGTPLDEADRRPWLAAITATINTWRAAGIPGVIACSALRRAHRASIAGGEADVRFIYLHGNKTLFASRLAGRQGHFMPPELLDSQFATLEEPSRQEPVLTVDAGLPPETLLETIIRAI